MTTRRTHILALASMSILTACAFADQTPTTQPTDLKVIKLRSSEIAQLKPAWTGNLQGRAIEQPLKTEKAAFLGVGVKPTDATLMSQLDLPKGVGLTVFFVEPDSPAALAGLQEHDVLHKLNDQLLINPAQLATLVRTFKPDEDITLTVLRKGKPETLKAKLVERELPVLADVDAMIRINGMPVLPEPGTAVFQRVPFEPSISGQRVYSPEEFNVKAFIDAAKVSDSERKFRVIRVQPGEKSQIIRKDGTHTIQIDTQDGERTVTISDNDGKQLYSGALNTPDDESKLPEDVRGKVKQMTDGIEVKMLPSTQPAAEPKAQTFDVRNYGC